MDSTYWMVEHFGHNGPQGHRWLRVVLTGSINGIQRAELLWHEDPQAALHFSREQDARAFALLHPEWCVLAQVTEHKDVPGVRVERVGPGDDEFRRALDTACMDLILKDEPPTDGVVPR
jgi:hypothetical protein